MRDQVLQTPKRDHQHGTRRSKSSLEHTKKNTNISKKCLDSAFTQVSEDVPFESPNDSCALSTISEISTDHLVNDDNEESWIAAFSPPVTPFPATAILSEQTPISAITVEKEEPEDAPPGHSKSSFNVSPAPLAFPSSENGVQSDLTPLSTATVEKYEVGNVLVDPCRPVNLFASGVDAVSMEAEMVVNHLKQARSQVVNSDGISANSKKLLDSLLEVVMEDLNALPEEKDLFAELCSKKSRVLFMSFLLWVFTALVIILFRHGNASSFSGPFPT